MLAESPPSPLGSRNTAFTVHRPSDISSAANEAATNVFHETRITGHESRITAFFRNTAFPVAPLVPVGTEALQSCFFPPRHARQQLTQAQSERAANQGFPGLHQPQATDFKVFTKHESRDTSHGLYVLNESRVTKHESRLCVFTNHGTRNMVSMVHVGTEALQSFFSGPACVA